MMSGAAGESEVFIVDHGKSTRTAGIGRCLSRRGEDDFETSSGDEER